MVKGKTSTGYKFEVNEAILNDWRFTKALSAASAKSDTAKVAGYTQMVSLLLGEEGEERLCEHCMQEDGTVPVGKISAEVQEIIAAIGEKAKK